MLHRSLLSMNLLLLAASCVPAATAGQLAGPPTSTADARIPGKFAPGEQQAYATEEPPPPDILAKEIAVGDPAAPFDVRQRSPADVHSALECLTAAIYYEARSESEDGQRAVAQVVLNRVRHPAFPKSVCGVVYQGSDRSTGCQFTFTCDGSLARMREPSAWSRAQRIASAAMGGYVFAPVGLATNYHTTAIHPWWADSMARAVTIGSHIFYRWRGEWGDPLAFRRPYVGGEAVSVASADGDAGGPDALETLFGVTVHRPGTGGSAAAAVASAPVAEESAGVRIHRATGPDLVRIHHGGEGDGGAASAAASGAGEGAQADSTH